MSEATETGVELIPIDQLAVKIPTLLETAKSQLAKIKEVVKNLAPIVDEASKEAAFAVKEKIKLAHDTYKDERMPFTRKLSEFVKQFTTLEAEYLEEIAKIQKGGDAYAAKEVARVRAAKEAQEAELRKKQAEIELEGRISELLRQKIEVMLDTVRKATGKMISLLTKDNLEETKAGLSKEPTWIPAKMDKFYYDAPDWVTNKARFKEIADADKDANILNYITQSKRILNDTLAIVEVALTNKEEAARLQEIAKEEDKKQNQAAAEEAEREIEAQKAIAQMDTTHIADAKAKVDMKIEILDNEAWVQMFAHWWSYDPEAKEKDLSKKTFLQIRTFCEKDVKNGRLIDHKSLRYIEAIKAK